MENNMTEEEIDKMAEAYETGFHWNAQIQSELKHTYWELDDMDLQIRELNQFCMENNIL